MDIQNLDCIAILDKTGEVIIKREHKKEVIDSIFHKIKNEKEEITIVGEKLVVYKNLDDTLIFISSNLETNEIFLTRALDTFYSALLTLLKASADKSNIIKKYDVVVLLLDSFVFEGILVEDDPEKLVENIPQRPFEGTEGMKIPKGFASIFSKASKSLRK